MANWSNLRLIVIGSPADVTLFRRAAGALEGHIDTKKSTVFIPDMEFGEGGDLQADAVTVFRRVYRQASYLFQGRNTDYVDHFKTVSRKFPTLAFVLVWSDPNVRFAWQLSAAPRTVANMGSPVTNAREHLQEALPCRWICRRAGQSGLRRGRNI